MRSIQRCQLEGVREYEYYKIRNIHRDLLSITTKYEASVKWLNRVICNIHGPPEV